MKNILSLFMLALSGSISAQYAAMLSELHTWKGVVYGLTEIEFTQRISGDSIIDDLVYKKIVTRNQYSSDEYLIALMREDPSTGHVYGRYGDQENLMYDFSLGLGESAVIYGISGEQNITINAVETIVVNGENRKLLQFEDSWMTAYWIEGIGSVYGPTDPVLGEIVDYGPTLQCHYISGNLVWSNPQNEEACSPVLAVEDFGIPVVEIWPIPVGELLHLRLSGLASQGTVRYDLISPDGKNVDHGRISGQGIHQIDISNQNPGVYILSLSSNSGRRCYKVIIC